MIKRVFKIIFLIPFFIIIVNIAGCSNNFKKIYLDKTFIDYFEDSELSFVESFNYGEYDEKEYGVIGIDDKGVFFELNDKQLENWKKTEKEWIDELLFQIKYYGNDAIISDDYKTFDYYVNDEIINSKNRDETVNAAIREILFAQFFFNSGESLHLTTTVYDLSNNILGTVEWPETTGYFGN